MFDDSKKVEKKDLTNSDSEWETIQLDARTRFRCAIFHRMDHTLNSYLVFDCNTHVSKVVIENDNINIELLNGCEDDAFADSAPVRAQNGNLYLLGCYNIIQYNDKENKISEHGKKGRSYL